MQRFTDKVALITGAGSGIGRATAVRLASEGAAVMLIDVNEAGLKETLGMLPEGAAAEMAVVDVQDSAACKAAVDQAVSTFGKLNVLCNIAGMGYPRNFEEFTDEEWQRLWNVNVSGMMYLCRAAMPELLKTGGNILNTSSTAGLVGQAYNVMYCATKGAVLLMTKALAAEFAGRGVRVNCICPGGVNTPLAAGYQFPEGSNPDLIMRYNSLVDPSEPSEIAASIAYICSDEARYVVGEALAIDGGQTCV